ncbi:MAG: hypothetical protein BRD29_00345 [Bacteroidetes bacterium QH_2_67_10]|nr:MAG: hypothetical protein BRD29_00345 [Bacteroidetes bacterium QH_2_67_10]
MTLAAPLHWGPDPNLLEWGPLPVRWYGLFFTSGFLLGPMLVGLFAARFSFFCAHFLRARQRGVAGLLVAGCSTKSLVTERYDEDVYRIDDPRAAGLAGRRATRFSSTATRRAAGAPSGPSRARSGRAGSSSTCRSSTRST